MSDRHTIILSDGPVSVDLDEWAIITNFSAGLCGVKVLQRGDRYLVSAKGPKGNYGSITRFKDNVVGLVHTTGQRAGVQWSYCQTAIAGLPPVILTRRRG